MSACSPTSRPGSRPNTRTRSARSASAPAATTTPSSWSRSIRRRPTSPHGRRLGTRHGLARRRPRADPAITGSWAGVIERLGDGVRASSGPTDGADAFAFAERPVVERAYLGWLGPTLAQARNAGRRGATGIQLGLPDGDRFTFDGALATALGPRDDDWLEAAIADPRVAIEITPWWSDAHRPPVPAEPGAGPDVAAGPLAAAGASRARRAARGRPSPAVEGLPDRARPALPVARLGRDRRASPASMTRWPARSISRAESRRRPMPRRSAIDATPSRSATRAGR